MVINRLFNKSFLCEDWIRDLIKEPVSVCLRPDVYYGPFSDPVSASSEIYSVSYHQNCWAEFPGPRWLNLIWSSVRCSACWLLSHAPGQPLQNIAEQREQPAPWDGAVRFQSLWWNHSCLDNSCRNHREGVVGDLCSSMRVMLSRFSCVWLCHPMDWSPPGSSVHGILQARILKCVAMPSFRGSSSPKDGTHICYISCIGRQVLYHLHRLGSWNPYASPLPQPCRRMVEWRASRQTLCRRRKRCWPMMADHHEGTSLALPGAPRATVLLARHGSGQGRLLSWASETVVGSLVLFTVRFPRTCLSSSTSSAFPTNPISHDIWGTFSFEMWLQFKLSSSFNKHCCRLSVRPGQELQSPHPPETHGLGRTDCRAFKN